MTQEEPSDDDPEAETRILGSFDPETKTITIAAEQPSDDDGDADDG